MGKGRGFWHQVGRWFGVYFWNQLTIYGFAFLLFLIPGVELVSQILGNTITSIDQFIIQMGALLPEGGGLVFTAALLLINTLLELMVFMIYPLHWTIYHRPHDGLTILLTMLPWIVGGFLTNLKLTRNWLEGIGVGVFTIIQQMIPGIIISILFALTGLLPVEAQVIFSAIQGIQIGLVDMPIGLAMILTVLEGGLIYMGVGIVVGLLKTGTRLGRSPAERKAAKGKPVPRARQQVQRPSAEPRVGGGGAASYGPSQGFGGQPPDQGRPSSSTYRY